MNIYFFLLSLVTLSGLVAGKHIRKSRSRIVFDPKQVIKIEMPQACKDEGREFCFDSDNYPTETVEELFRNVSGLIVADKDAPVVSYVDREGSPLEYECHDRSETNTIYYIEDEEGVDRAVVQLKGRFEQQFSVNWCENEGSISSKTQHFMRHVVKHHKMYCQNKYMHYDFLVLSKEPGYDGKYKMEKARTKTGIPVCCMCRYDKKF